MLLQRYPGPLRPRRPLAPGKAHPVFCQHWDIEESATVPYAAHIRASQDDMDPRHLLRPGGIKTDNTGVR